MGEWVQQYASGREIQPSFDRDVRVERETISPAEARVVSGFASISWFGLAPALGFVVVVVVVVVVVGDDDGGWCWCWCCYC